MEVWTKELPEIIVAVVMLSKDETLTDTGPNGLSVFPLLDRIYSP